MGGMCTRLVGTAHPPDHHRARHRGGISGEPTAPARGGHGVKAPTEGLPIQVPAPATLRGCLQARLHQVQGP
uniref:Uncharacterized protein n=1 Tax=Arundo donax TaxID=35708 RepID=A0A0A9AY08_ARUDO